MFAVAALLGPSDDAAPALRLIGAAPLAVLMAAARVELERERASVSGRHSGATGGRARNPGANARCFAVPRVPGSMLSHCPGMTRRCASGAGALRATAGSERRQIARR